MSSTGIRRIRNTDSRTADSILAADKAQIESEKIFAESNTTTGNNGAGISNQRTAAGNYLKNSGDIRLGPMGNDTSIVEVVDDNISVDNSSLNYTPHVFVNTEEGLDDDLTSITPGTNPFLNQELTIQLSDADSTLTIKEDLNETGPILTPNSVDIILEYGDTVDLIYSGLVSSWIVVGSSKFGEGSGGDPTVLNNLDSVDHGSIGLISELFDLDEGNFHFFEAVGDVSITFTNLPVSGKWEPILLKITQDSIGGHAITFTQTIENGSPTIDTTADAITVVKFYMYNDGTSDIIRAGDWDASGGEGGLNTNLSNLSSSAIPGVALNLNFNDITEINRLQISGGTTTPTSVNDVVWYLDSDGNLISNVNTADGFIWSSGNVANMVLTDSTLQKRNVTAPIFELFNTRDAEVGTAGTIQFLANTATFPDGAIMGFIFADTEVITTTGSGSLRFGVNLNGVSTEFFNLNDGNDEEVNFLQNLDMNSHDITNASYIASDTDNRPGSGFIRMAFADELRMRNSENGDDVIIQAALTTLDIVTQDAIAFTIAGGVQMYVGEFDISVQQNDIVNTGSILPNGTGGNVGDSTNFYSQMHSQFFVPEAATIITNRYGLSRTSSDNVSDYSLYVNYPTDDGTTLTSGAFGIYEEGIRKFLFHTVNDDEYELFIGSDPFTSDETYRIQMGENSNSSAEITLTEGSDLLIHKTGVATALGIKLQTGGLDRLYATSSEILLSVPLNMGGSNITDLVNITSNGEGAASTGVIGEIITSNGGFDYYVRDNIFWDTDANTFIGFSSTGITISTDDTISLQTDGASENITLTASGTTNSSITLTGVTNVSNIVGDTQFQVASGVIQASGGNIFLSDGAEYIGFNEEVTSSSIDTPATGDINLFNDSDTGELSIKWRRYVSCSCSNYYR